MFQNFHVEMRSAKRKNKMSILGLVVVLVAVFLVDLFVAPTLLNQHHKNEILLLIGFGLGALDLVLLGNLILRIVEFIRLKLFIKSINKE